MQRILVVEVNWRGDVLFSTPFIRAIRESSPSSFIAALVVERCVPILENNKDLNEVIVFESQTRHKGFLGSLRLISLLRSKRFDTAFLLHRSLSRTMICFMAGIPERVGYYTRKRSLFLTKKISPPNRQLHKVDYFLHLANACGIATVNKDYQFHPSSADQDFVDNLLKAYRIGKDDFLVVINPGGNWDLKRWPKANFARLSDELIAQYGAKVFITGAEKDLKLTQDISARMLAEPIILCGQTTFGQLAALMSRAKVVIANDSGPMHLAVSQKTKVIALFGPTSFAITGPQGSGDYKVIQKDVGCRVPCYKLNCADNRCMEAISIEDVLLRVKELVGRNG